jgi:hypothetical protein
MKRLLFIIVLVGGMPILSSFSSRESNSPKIEVIYKSEFCEGWEEGYCEGWKDVKGQYAICPITPICPIPEIGQDNYRGGYNRGFKAGTRAAYRN